MQAQFEPKNVNLFPREKLGSLQALNIVIVVPLPRRKIVCNVMQRNHSQRILISPFIRESLILIEVLNLQ